MMAQRLYWPIALLIIAIWELLFSFGFIDPARISHPLGSVRFLMSPAFLQGFGILLVQVAGSLVVGAAIALALRTLIARNDWLTSSSIPWLRTGMWFPFIVYWALPIWSPREITFLQAFALAFSAICAVITLAGLYYFLLAHAVPALKSQNGLPLGMTSVIYQGLLMALVAQVWMAPHGWPWYFFPAPEGPTAGLYAAFLLLVFLSFIIHRLSRLDFDQSATVRGAVLIQALQSRSRAIIGPLMITLVVMFLWQLLGSAGLFPEISSPLRVAKAAWRFVVFSAVISNEYSTNIWRHLLLSIWEILAGIAVAGGLSLLIYGIVSSKETARKQLFPILPFTFVVPIVFSVLFIIWTGILSSGQTVAGVAFLTFFPFLQALWALRDRRPLCRILLAIDDALPFGFVAMLFGEAMSSIAGLELLMSLTHADERLTDKGLAVAMLTMGALIILSGSLRYIAKRGLTGSGLHR